MKKLVLLSLLLLVSITFVLGQAANGQNNSIENTDNGSAIGYGTESRGSYSFAAGYSSRAAANGSFAFGKNAVAENQFGFALGNGVVSSADYAWIIGSGYSSWSGISDVSNGFVNSLFIGFNSTGRPSLFVKPFDSNGESGGFVGIHTNNPSSQLDVNGITTTNSLFIDGTERPFVMPHGAGNNYVLTCDAEGVASWQAPTQGGGTTESYWTANNNNIFFMDVGEFGNNTARVGIGTDEPEARLHVQADGWKAIFQGPEGYIMLGPLNSYSAHIFTDRPRFIFNKDVYNTTGGFSSYNGGDLFLKTTGTNRITILNSNGHVGIGTDDPNADLDVAGNTIISNELNVGGIIYANSEINYSSAQTGIISFGGSSGESFMIKSLYDGNGAGKTAIRGLSMDKWGNVGIGTDDADDANALEINGRTQTLSFAMTYGAAEGRLLQSDADGNASWVIPESVNGIGVWDENNGIAHYIGKVGINTDFVPTDFHLAVQGAIVSQRVVVTMDENVWPDYVFSDNYELPELSEIESFVKEHKHLPDVPSAREVKENGQDLGAMNTILLQKIEELTLLMIEQQKEINALKEQVNR